MQEKEQNWSPRGQWEHLRLLGRESEKVKCLMTSSTFLPINFLLWVTYVCFLHPLSFGIYVIINYPMAYLNTVFSIWAHCFAQNFLSIKNPNICTITTSKCNSFWFIHRSHLSCFKVCFSVSASFTHSCRGTCAVNNIFFWRINVLCIPWVLGTASHSALPPRISSTRLGLSSWVFFIFLSMVHLYEQVWQIRWFPSSTWWPIRRRFAQVGQKNTILRSR